MTNDKRKLELVANQSKTNTDVIIRKSRAEDAERIAELARLCFDPPEIAFTKRNFVSQIEKFPEGQICVELNGEIIGSCSSLIVNIDEYPKYHTLAAISDNGNIQNHNPNGKHLYGIDVIVHPQYRGLKMGKRLYNARRQVCENLGLQSVIFGGRIPNYHKYATTMTVEEYVGSVLKKNIFDPVLTFQLKSGFQFKYILPNYIPTDHESMYFATFMEWLNTN
jgi:ribosomal protein S18 acetylase RimI-like enzyme